MLLSNGKASTGNDIITKNTLSKCEDLTNKTIGKKAFSLVIQLMMDFEVTHEDNVKLMEKISNLRGTICNFPGTIKYLER